MGLHLRADINHDFGTLQSNVILYNIGTDKTPVLTEDRTLDYFLNGDGRAIIENLAARKAGEVVFPVPEKTASFQNWKAPLLFQGGNDKIGIVQDAGEFITQRIGAKNVITFGSILDPAGKPIRPDQGPIWFQPQTNGVLIPLAPFGFDSNVIQSIVIKDLTAGTVKAGFQTTKYGLVDAVAMLSPAPQVQGGKPKPINNTDVAKAGFFTSINKADNIDTELVSSGVFPNTSKAKAFTDKYATYFYIGKTLGDAMLVASAMKTFPDNKAGETQLNPYYGIGGTTWASWTSSGSSPSPSVLALKTGDRLNWLRAIIMNVPAIYEDQAKGGRKVKQYRFFPGTPDPTAVKTALLADFDAMIVDVTNRYKALSDSMNGLFVGQIVNPKLTNFAPGGDITIRDEASAILAGGLIKDIQTKLAQVQASVLSWITKRKGNAVKLASNDALQAYYVKTLERANECSPQTNSIFIQKGKQEPYLSSKVVVANVPAGAAVGDEYPLANSLDIALRNAFVRLKGATPATYAERIKGTDIDNRFLSKVPVQAPAPAQAPGDIEAEEEPPLNPWEGRLRQRGGDVGTDLDLSSLKDTLGEVVGRTDQMDDVLVYQVVPKDAQEQLQVGGARFLRVEFFNIGKLPASDREPAPELESVISLFPRIADFIGYMKACGVYKRQHWFLAIYDVIRRRNTDRVVDGVLANELMMEFLQMVGQTPNTTKYIDIPGASTGVFAPDYVYSDRKYPSSTATLLFNAYTYNVNARNATLIDAAQNEVPTQSTKDFATIEALYLSKIPTIDLMSGRIPLILVVDTPRMQGGLRERRPLYSNAVLTRTGSLGSHGDARLRRRARARRTSRVRKQSRKSKTRR